MSRATSTRAYGKSSRRTKAQRLFAELPQSPLRRPPPVSKDEVDDIAKQISSITLEKKPASVSHEKAGKTKDHVPTASKDVKHSIATKDKQVQSPQKVATPPTSDLGVEVQAHVDEQQALRVLTWADVCPPGDRISKIAEASFAEVYRVTNDRGTSIIKVIRLESPIRPLTKTQINAGLVDEEPHAEGDIHGELQISEWLADIPGFVVYKERYLVQGKTSRQLLETHQVFQKKMKRKDPGRAQFYPSPSRYLDDTKFLVVELGDAGIALEDWHIKTGNQLWDIFFLQSIALARAEDLAAFEHRDLHEGNLCIRDVRPERKRNEDDCFFGFSGLEITILDYGLSRAEGAYEDNEKIVAFDMEKDLGLFTSTHAAQCDVYRRMRSYLLRADRTCLPPEAHDTAYDMGPDGPISWDVYAPYTNVLWLAYLYEYLVANFVGHKADLAQFKAETSELWDYLNPEAEENIPCFGSAADIVCFAVEAGWVKEEQLMDASESMLEREGSIVLSRDERDEETGETRLRRSSRRTRPPRSSTGLAPT